METGTYTLHEYVIEFQRKGKVEQRRFNAKFEGREKAISCHARMVVDRDVEWSQMYEQVTEIRRARVG